MNHAICFAGIFFMCEFGTVRDSLEICPMPSLHTEVLLRWELNLFNCVEYQNHLQLGHADLLAVL